MNRNYHRPAIIAAGFASVVMSCAALAATPPNYPNKPIRMIAANSAGGGLDIVARAISPKLAAVFGYQVVVDNRAGAAGSLASEITAHAPADGHTILVASLGGLAVNTNLYKGLNYDPLRDLTAITWATSQSNVLVVNMSVPVKTVQELIALARAQPGKLTYGSSGAGNAGHLAAELFKSMTKTDMVHVPYKGGAPAMIDLIAGQVQLVFSSAPTAVPQVKAGKIRGIAVTTIRRSTALPELPTIAESGLPGFEAAGWYGFFTTTGTPRAVLDKLNAEIVRAVSAPDLSAKIEGMGLVPAPQSLQEAAGFVAAEAEKWTRAVRASGASAD